MSKKKGIINWPWFDKKLEERGLTLHAIRYEHHFDPENIRAWDRGKLARPHSLRKLAGILGMEYKNLVEGLHPKVMTAAIRRKRAQASQA